MKRILRLFLTSKPCVIPAVEYMNKYFLAFHFICDVYSLDLILATRMLFACKEKGGNEDFCEVLRKVGKALGREINVKLYYPLLIDFIEPLLLHPEIFYSSGQEIFDCEDIEKVICQHWDGVYLLYKTGESRYGPYVLFLMKAIRHKEFKIYKDISFEVTCICAGCDLPLYRSTKKMKGSATGV